MYIVQENPVVYFMQDKIPPLQDSTKTYQDLVAISLALQELSSTQILKAYKSGLFPWFEKDSFAYWFCPIKRMIIDTNSLKLSKSLTKLINKNQFIIKFNQDFRQIITACAFANRKHEDTTWITNDYINVYSRLFEQGFGFCVGAYLQGELVGGLYGLRLGDAYFGESMFANLSNASKLAFGSFAKALFAQNPNAIIDCQVPSAHLQSLGGYEISKAKFLQKLSLATQGLDLDLNLDLSLDLSLADLQENPQENLQENLQKIYQ